MNKTGHHCGGFCAGGSDLRAADDYVAHDHGKYAIRKFGSLRAIASRMAPAKRTRFAHGGGGAQPSTADDHGGMERQNLRTLGLLKGAAQPADMPGWPFAHLRYKRAGFRFVGNRISRSSWMELSALLCAARINNLAEPNGSGAMRRGRRA